MTKGWKKKHRSDRVSRKYHVDLLAQAEPDPRFATILEGLLHYRLMRAIDVQLLLGQSTATTYRLLQTLFHNKMIKKEWMEAEDRGRGGQRTAVHYLTTRGYDFLRREHHKSDLDTPYFAPTSPDMSQTFMRHTAGITNSMLHLQLAAEARGWWVHQYRNEWFFKIKNIKRRKSPVAKDEKMALKVEVETGQFYKHGKMQGQPRTDEMYLEPDAFIVIQSEYGKVPLFHEHDRNTESQEKWQQKVRAYNALFQTGLFEHLFGWRGFRVITTVHAKQRDSRVNTLISYTEAIPNIGSKFFFIHEDDLDINTALTEPIWQAALSPQAKNNGRPRMRALVYPPEGRGSMS